MQNPKAQPLQHVGDECAVAPPPQRFSTQDRSASTESEALQSHQRFREFLGFHVVGVAPERGTAPGSVDRIRASVPAASQLWEPEIVEAAGVEGGTQRGALEVGPPSGSRVSPDIGHCLDVVSRQQRREFVQRTRRVTDGPDGGEHSAKVVGPPTSSLGYYEGMTSREASRLAPVFAGFLLGLGLGGFLDGILLHQILQWHNMLSAVDPPTTMAAMRRNMTADGAFHAATWLCTVLGLVVLCGAAFDVGRRQPPAWLCSVIWYSGGECSTWSKARSIMSFWDCTTFARGLSLSATILHFCCSVDSDALSLGLWVGSAARVSARDSDSGGKGGQPRRAQVQEEDRNLEQHERVVNPKIGELLFEPGKVAATTL